MQSLISAEFIDDILVANILLAEMRNFDLVQQVKDELVGAINERIPRAMILDLSRVEFIGSVGFLAFLAVRRALQGQQIILCNLTVNVREIFELCRLVPHQGNNHTPFVAHSTLQAALAVASKDSEVPAAEAI